MELVELELTNFRQFRDESVQFACGPQKSITVVHGSNGSGKTTLLNAFTWLFYEEVDFDTRPDRLASEGAMADAAVGEEVPVSVTLRFNHDGTEYVARRSATYQKGSENDFDGEMADADIELRYRDATGSWKTRSNPSNTLDQIIPERLSGLFFFDGEDIDELAGIDNQDRIQEAIQNIMGLTILERATRHLDTVADRFEKEVSDTASDELRELIDEKRGIESKIDELNSEKSNTESSVNAIKSDIKEIEAKQKLVEDTADIQQEREKLRKQRDSVEGRIEEINNEIHTEISENGFVPLALPLFEEVATEIDEMREQGLIPSELSNSFIDSMLESGNCVCGRPLTPGTEHYEQVQAMKGDAVVDGVEQSALRIIGHLNTVSDRESELFKAVDDLIKKRSDQHDKLQRIEEEIDELNGELEGSEETTESGETVAELESKRQELENQKEDLIAKVGRIEQQIDEKNEEITELEDEIEEQEDERDETLVAKRRQKTAELVRDELKGSFDQLKNKVRRWSNEKIQETFSEIASKNLTAEITDDFELKIWQDIGTDRVEVDKSTGERQVASLAFIGSLVSIARMRYEDDSDSEYFTGGIYPLVMDSPFGALDKNHRRQVSRVIPKLGNQVVVFATDSQWEGPVEEEMQSLAGQQYWLDFDDGEGAGSYPQTKIKSDKATVRGD